MSGEHAILAPSSAARRWACAGSRAMEAAQPPEAESPESVEGTAAHWALAWLLMYGMPPDVGAIADNGYPIDQDMIDGAYLCAESVFGITQRYGLEIASEQHVTMHDTIHPLCDGTPDVVAVDETRRVIYLWDYKYGHAYIDPYQYPQLIEYLAGIIERIRLAIVDDQTWSFRAFIVQPRNYHRDGPVREWNGRLSDLRGLFNIASGKEYKSMQPDAQCTPTPEGCRDCRARHACDVLQRVGSHGMSLAGSNVPFDPPPHLVGRELRDIDRAMKLLEARRTGLASQAEQFLLSGKTVPFYQMERNTPREKWTVDDATLESLGKAYNVTLTKPKAITPQQARNLKVDEAVISQYSVRPPGALQLAPLDPSSAAKVFK